MTRDVWIGLATFGVAVLYWLGADRIRLSPLDGPVTAQGLPKSLAYALGCLAILLVVRGLTVERRVARAAGPRPRLSAEERREALRPHLRAAGMLALGVGYLMVLHTLGYILSLILLMTGVALYIGERPRPTLFVTAILGALLFYVIFVVGLGIPLPDGLLAPVLG